LTGTADSAGAPVTVASFTTVTVNPWVGRSSDTYTLTVKVRALTGPTPTGDVTVTVAGKPYTATLEDGRATITLDPQTRGVRIVTAEYAGSETVEE
ncbi:hypothetical protein ACV2X7_27630, partial [Escherichia coli]